MVEFLLEQGASVHLRDRLGESALWFAIRERQKSIIVLLRRAGAHFSQDELIGIRKRVVRLV